ncbi:MAG: oligosaccharide repeat unit polymerase [Euryarchaeota archaeon]|nr:oligosaccharide repeat unit polymerase [Euryarchaeota archaeon]
MSEDQLSKEPPRVAHAQWALCILMLILASLAPTTTDVEMRTAVTILAGLSIALVISCGIEALHTRSLGKTLLMASVFLFFWIDALTMAYEALPFATPRGGPTILIGSQYPGTLVSTGLFYVALFQVMLLAGYSYRPDLGRVGGFVRARVDSLSDSKRNLKIALVALAILPWLAGYRFDVIEGVTDLIESRSHDEAMAQGDWGRYLYPFGMFGMALVFAEAVVSKPARRPPWLGLAGLGIMIAIFGGARHILLFVLLPALALGLLSFRAMTRKRALTVIAAAVVVLLLFQAQFAYRQYGWDKIGTYVPNELGKLSSVDQFSALLFAEYLVPSQHPYFLEPTIHYFALHWIPRMFWADKPIVETWQYFNSQYTQGDPGYNVTPSIIGQYYMSWGILGIVFIALWLGFLMVFAERLLRSLDLQRQRCMAVSLVMLMAFVIASFRLYAPVYFGYFAYGFLATILLTYPIPTRAPSINAAVGATAPETT